ncbi:hypothetical protein [Aeromonas veronii]|uniref:hypothetical protein n=1 Tax=Aeromonas veronii TaxID=654 RepID=UPI00111647F9|nr:hypothetical protein [Aeromonas veronii]TNI98275.1 hypothetical protein CF114_10280 [Aeromonas veronii]
MKRYDLELTATGPVMEEREQGAFVPFSEISGLAEQLADATRQCGVMADLLREARNPLITAMEVSSEDESAAVEELIDSIDSTLAGKLPDRQDTEWTDSSNSPVAADYRELQERHDQLQSRLKGALDLLQESHEVMRRIIPPLPQDCSNRSDLLDRIEVALAGQFSLPAWYLDGAKDFKSMMLDASTALFHPHIEGVFAVFERRLALDDQPQGGEPCALEPRSSSPA